MMMHCYLGFRQVCEICTVKWGTYVLFNTSVCVSVKLNKCDATLAQVHGENFCFGFIFMLA